MIEATLVRPPESKNQSTIGDRLAAVGMQYIGTPSHVPAGLDRGISPEGFTCSGFVAYLLPKIGVQPFARTTHEFAQRCHPVNWTSAKRGDLLLFTTRTRKRPGLQAFHMGVLLNRSAVGVRYLHAPGLHNSQVRIDENSELIPGYVWDQPELLPDYLQIRRIPEEWSCI